MAGAVSDILIAQVEAHLPADIGVPPRIIHRKLGGEISSPAHIRAALLHLVRTGRATRDGDIGSYRYRRATRVAT